MFTRGQLIFAILFAMAFFVAMIYAYHKDKKLHNKYYRGSVWVLIVFISFLLMIAAIKFFLG